MHALVEAGADLLELGVPFSDPMADGPVIQAASECALAQGVGVAEVLAMVADFRRRDPDTPIVLMGYLNPIHRYGWSSFSEDAAAAGVDGVLLVDAPPEASKDLKGYLDRCGLHQIFLVAPTTSDLRARLISGIASGFVYYVAIKGVTGAVGLSADSVRAAVDRLRDVTDLPIGVGFGINGAEDARRLGACADAIVIGSALVSQLDRAVDRAEACDLAKAFLAPIRLALDQVAGSLSSNPGKAG
jgi:tryptophan synthase alpha chain